MMIVAGTFAMAGCERAGESLTDPGEAAVSCPGAANYDEQGVASWYGRSHHGRRTASGESFDMNELTASHRWLPFGTKVTVTNLANGQRATLVVNDRGPYVDGRILDVSRRAARELGFLDAGVTRVRVTAAAPCP
ncbi:MAG: septal ring lytic transglycosylase RlpA family protein [Alphaproteobacteria bacterium]